jgi:methionine biosynthesis protein MetW
VTGTVIEMAENYNCAKKYGGYSPEVFLLVPPKSSVLDIGCSTGKLARVLTQEKGCRVVGIDIDRESLDKASRYCEKVFECDLDDSAKLRRLLSEKQFDAITMGDVLEHLKYPGSLLAMLRKHLKTRGVIIASIPNAAFISLRIRFLLGNFSYNKEGEGGLVDRGHLRFFSFRTTEQLFKKAGYEIKKIYGISIVKDKFWFLRPLAKIFPTLFALHIIVVAQKNR